ncbi:hypothetical protein EVAR_51613_1 [Eumeta japonica]|uniref:Uncharacterized protein n=1 Tax=Eumeta variegata TaxID=151549 RepID=A0A4C1YF91_EUMVA|nr:hypothetical protein EVAR_51613_1 [Eumeta japonica]
MSDEPEARMWEDETGHRFGAMDHEPYFEAAFVTEQLDRAPLLSETAIASVVPSDRAPYSVPEHVTNSNSAPLSSYAIFK